MSRENRWAYFAGLFDGEGSVTMHYRSSDDCLSCSLVVGNTHRGVLEEGQRLFGGAIKERRGTNRPMYVLQMCGETADLFAQAILPYAIIKESQLRFFLETREKFVNLGWGTTTPEVVEGRREAARHLKLLKRAA
jgi:hypothetical protein